mmetsp:Transcript_32288/g.102697  ORF Transcript_32288/g.102697 Transcript_32288/m.102697 type:complete len:214 (-) Transcript_32288:571-1212(-)|eukprot:CAMPEP_0118871090 /NCGR_PEP_ID=MMETSP1163-20130328/13797_1 /TAXON_ID=124430 /ORGANISM="Phaeomonas parva, Strain CCMP2877" /LENGTH=213 /DNA_ID=CAMNT_0006806157 /DNA_START=289 /DNA_END=930 /DNA_ORIENTATION=+
MAPQTRSKSKDKSTRKRSSSKSSSNSAPSTPAAARTRTRPRPASMFAMTPFFDRRAARDPWGNALAPFDDSFFRPMGELMQMPTAGRMDQAIKVDLSETDSDVLVAADVPGFAKEEIKVDINNNVLTISAETNESGEEPVEEKEDMPAADAEGVKHHLRERSGTRKWSRQQKVSRSMRLPAHVDAAMTEAKYEDGTLKLKMPKVSHHSTITIN